MLLLHKYYTRKTPSSPFRAHFRFNFMIISLHISPSCEDHFHSNFMMISSHYILKSSPQVNNEKKLLGSLQITTKGISGEKIHVDISTCQESFSSLLFFFFLSFFFFFLSSLSRSCFLCFFSRRFSRSSSLKKQKTQQPFKL